MTRRDVLLKALGSMPSDVERLVRGARPPEERAASLAATLGVMLSFESAYRTQLERVVREDCPLVPALGGDENGSETNTPVPELAARYVAARLETLAFLQALTPADWQRKARHATLGDTSLRYLIQHLVAFDNYHLGRLLGMQQNESSPATPVMRPTEPNLNPEVTNEPRRKRERRRRRIPRD
jgi:hypothetical protein